MKLTKLIKLVILGPPGSGKGTISNWLASDFNLNYISCGDILRNQISSQTDDGKKAQSFISQGFLVSNELVTRLIINTLKKEYENKNWILDGFPRTVKQAQSLLEYTKLSKVINLNVPDEEIINRVKNRWIHLKSGRIYHLEYNPPKVPFTDDLTGEKLIQRDDDKPEAVKQRLSTYSISTLPVLEFFGDKELLVEFTGNESKAIYSKIKRYMMEYLNYPYTKSS